MTDQGNSGTVKQGVAISQVACVRVQDGSSLSGRAGKRLLVNLKIIESSQNFL